MSSVTARIKEIKQPYGGFIKPSEFTTLVLEDDYILTNEVNIHHIIIGLCVDYLTRAIITKDKKEAFYISLRGAERGDLFGETGLLNVALNLLEGISGIDDQSIINACKLVTFDTWIRNPVEAKNTKGYNETNPDKTTIEDIRILIKRGISFFESYGPVIKDGFTFEPEIPSQASYLAMLISGKGTYGGYTPIVESGDGDFLTKDTLWDFKVSKAKPTSKHTLQLLMYWIMGQRSGQEVFKSIDKLGIFNPKLNTIYTLEVKNIPIEVIKKVENDIICY